MKALITCRHCDYQQEIEVEGVDNAKSVARRNHWHFVDVIPKPLDEFGRIPMRGRCDDCYEEKDVFGD